LYALHYYLIGAYTGSALNVIVAIRSAVFVRNSPNRHNRWLLWTFCLASGALTLLAWQGPVSLLAGGGTIVRAIASWQKQPRRIRRLSLAVTTLWLLYSASVGSIAGIVMQVIALVSNVIGQYRFDVRCRTPSPAAARRKRSRRAEYLLPQR